MSNTIELDELELTSRQTESAFASARCRFCKSPLRHTFVDLGMSPLCESYLTLDQLNRMEPFYPLHVQVCEACYLVQLEAYVSPEHIFTEYAYFSSYSDSWLKHSSNYVQMISERFGWVRTAWRSSWPATMATCCSILSRREFPS